METVFDVIQSLQLNISQVVAVGVLLFVTGYLIGTVRVKRLVREKHGLEKAVMALNEELLYGTPPAGVNEPESLTPVIDLKLKNYKSSQLAKKLN